MIFYISYILLQLSVSFCSKEDTFFTQNVKELILCRKCGSDVADSSYLVDKVSPGAHKTEKQDVFGQRNVTIQTLVNPYGIQFDIITAKEARCEHIGNRHAGDSWFPGYSWRICTCPHCGHHLGWTFENVTPISSTANIVVNKFHGLILSNILEENFTDSLIVMPKMYRM